MKLYHGTSEKFAKVALHQGLKPRGDRASQWKIASSKDRVYLTSAYALYFAANASEEKERWAVLEVDTDLLLPHRLVPDEDFLEQATRGKQELFIKGTMIQRTKWFRKHAEQFSHHWEQSVAGLGNCAYQGEIPVEAITRVAYFDSTKNFSMAVKALDPTITLLNYRIVGGTYRALLKWLFGDPVEMKDLFGPGFEVIGEEHQKAFEEAVNNRSGIQVLTTR